jgi:predicted GIY-YIG superfamily endonuclease
MATATQFWVYILECADGSYYVGHTEALESRLAAHRRGTMAGYTATRRPVRLVWADVFADRESALRGEMQVKGWSRTKKRALIERDWSRVQDLTALRADTRQAHPGIE